MMYQIICTLGKWRVWAISNNGDAEVVKVFSTKAAAERWVAKHS